MKITKQQLRKIIREEKTSLANKTNFGSNADRQNVLKETAHLQSPMAAIVNSHLPLVESMFQEWDEAEEIIWADRPDPRAEDIYELLFQLRERMMAVLENRE